MLAVVMSAVPTLLAAIVTEGLAFRQVWLHALLGAAVSAASFFVSPHACRRRDRPDVADTAIIAAAGVFGGRFGG